MESYRWTPQINQIIVSDSGAHQILPGLVLWAEVQKDCLDDIVKVVNNCYYYHFLIYWTQCVN